MPRRLSGSAGAILAAPLTLTLALTAACGGSSKPTAAPSPSVTPTPTATVTATPVEATCPLTGLPPKAGQYVGRVAVAVKIDNVDEARPQAGLDHADLVIEETVEGGLTRLMAIFQCDQATTLGPIRSARTSDGDMLRLLNGAVFGFSGANPRALAPVARTSKAMLLSYDAFPQFYYRSSARPAPHNVYSSTKTILRAGLARKKGLHAPPRLFLYGAPAHIGRHVRNVTMTWPSATAGWTWNGHVWLRTQNGTPDNLADGHRVFATNVIVMSIRTRYTGLHDVLGHASPEDVTTGAGKVWVFRNGKVINGTWHRANRKVGFTLKDAHGAPLKLQPGRTWIELMPHPGRPHIS